MKLVVVDMFQFCKIVFFNNENMYFFLVTNNMYFLLVTNNHASIEPLSIWRLDFRCFKNLLNL